jgi:hypothetical protein
MRSLPNIGKIYIQRGHILFGDNLMSWFHLMIVPVRLHLYGKQQVGTKRLSEASCNIFLLLILVLLPHTRFSK